MGEIGLGVRMSDTLVKTGSLPINRVTDLMETLSWSCWNT